MRRDSGFTLIELILVTVIIGILAGAVALNVRGRITQTSVSRAKQDIKVIETAVDAYALDHQDKLPKSLKDLNTPERNYLKGGNLGIDPWNNPYEYRVPGQHNKGGYDLYSKGPDGLAGTGDDITNWASGS